LRDGADCSVDGSAMKVPLAVRSGAVAVAGGFLTTVGLASAVWDNSSALLGIAAVGIALIVAARLLAPPRRRRALVLGGTLLGILLYPALLLVWFAWFYDWP